MAGARRTRRIWRGAAFPRGRGPLALPAMLLGGIMFASAAAGEPLATEGAISGACQRMFDWIVAEPVRFHQSATTVRSASHAMLERLAEFAIDCPSPRIRITGHTDAEGGPAYNQALSEQRAAVVADFLAALGVPRGRLVVQGAGASQPLADNGTAFGRERNRRIELALLAPGDEGAPPAGGDDPLLRDPARVPAGSASPASSASSASSTNPPNPPNPPNPR